MSLNIENANPEITKLIAGSHTMKRKTFPQLKHMKLLILAFKT